MYLSPHIYEIPFDDEWLVYAADANGLPVLMPVRLRRFLNLFNGGKTVGQIVAQNDGMWEISEALQAANWLFERGYLLDWAKPFTHEVENPHSDDGPPPDALEFWIHITNNCNLACRYCFVEGKNVQRMSDDVIDATVRRIGATARKYTLKQIVLKFAGGSRP